MSLRQVRENVRNAMRNVPYKCNTLNEALSRVASQLQSIEKMDSSKRTFKKRFVPEENHRLLQEILVNFMLDCKRRGMKDSTIKTKTARIGGEAEARETLSRLLLTYFQSLNGTA